MRSKTEQRSNAAFGTEHRTEHRWQAGTGRQVWNGGSMRTCTPGQRVAGWGSCRPAVLATRATAALVLAVRMIQAPWARCPARPTTHDMVPSCPWPVNARARAHVDERIGWRSGWPGKTAPSDTVTPEKCCRLSSRGSTLGSYGRCSTAPEGRPLRPTEPRCPAPARCALPRYLEYVSRYPGGCHLMPPILDRRAGSQGPGMQVPGRVPTVAGVCCGSGWALKG